MRLPAFALAVLLLLIPPALAQPYSRLPSHEELVAALRQGGMILVFRHGLTDDYPEQPMLDARDCARQRKLSEQGRFQARSIGFAFQNLGFKVDRVVASPYCRCMDTAREAFGKAEPALDVVDGLDPAALQARFAVVPRPGFNDVIVGHHTAGGLVGQQFLNEAEAVVVRPLGNGRFESLVRVSVERWMELVPRFRVQ